MNAGTGVGLSQNETSQKQGEKQQTEICGDDKIILGGKQHGIVSQRLESLLWTDVQIKCRNLHLYK